MIWLPFMLAFEKLAQNSALKGNITIKNKRKSPLSFLDIDIKNEMANVGERVIQNDFWMAFFFLPLKI